MTSNNRKGCHDYNTITRSGEKKDDKACFNRSIFELAARAKGRSCQMMALR